MNVNVKLFARACDLAGAPSLNVEVDGAATVASLRRALIAARPSLAAIADSLHVAVNGDYAADNCMIPPEAEVACFPPVSGG